MRITPRSLRWRLQAWYGVLLLGVLCAFGFAAYHLEKTERLHTVDSDLQRRLSILVNAMRAGRGRAPVEGTRPPPPPNFKFSPEVEALFAKDSGCYYVIWMRAPQPFARSAAAPGEVPRPAPGDEIVRTRDGDVRETFLFAAPADCVLVGCSVADEESLLFSHAALLAVSGAVLLALGLIGGTWLVARMLKPVEDISATAARIAAGDLAQRIPLQTSDSELSRVISVLNTTFAQLEATFSQQARFTADAAHELRTPVTVLLSETQGALTRERSPADYRESLETCQRAAQRMRRLIELLLDLARLEAGQEVLSRRNCDLAVIASQCLAEVATLARDRHVTTDADLSLSPCKGDPERLGQVVTNVLTNAIQHTKPGGSVRIETSTNANNVTLSVSDTGAGISAEDLPHIFERFYRGDKSRTGAQGNTGLGLSIAQAIVLAHGGTIKVHSEVGKGTTISISLPGE